MYDLQEMGGWKSSAMVRRYAHLAPAQMARSAEVVGRLLAVADQARASHQYRSDAGRTHPDGSAGEDTA